MTIIERLKAATGPDREIDARIKAYLEPDFRFMTFPGDIRGKRPAEYEPLAAVINSAGDWQAEFWGDVANICDAEKWTSSLDAALALVERMLGKTSVYMSSTEEGVLGERFHRAEIGSFGSQRAATLVLAILCALFTALEAKERKP